MNFDTPSMLIQRRPDQIVEIRPNPTWDRPDTFASVQQNIQSMRRALGSTPRGLLVLMPEYHLSKEILSCYRDADLQHVAAAILTDSFRSRVLGNLYLQVLRSSTREEPPIQLFSERLEAEQWLLYKVVPSAVGRY